MNVISKFFNWLNRISQKVKQKKKNQKELLRLYDKKLLVQDFLKSNNISYSKITSVETILGFDFNSEKVEEVKSKLSNRQPLSVDEFSDFTYDQDHVHVLSILLDNEKKHFLIVLYPYEYLATPRILWSYRVN